MTSTMSSLIKNVKTVGLRFRLVDARGQVVGRLAAQLATILQGKDKPTYSPHEDDGDIIVVINAEHVDFTGKKWDKKLYRWHTGFPGGLKQRTAQEQFAKDPSSILREAVVGMLPKNNLRKGRDRKLRIFPSSDHPFQDHPRLIGWEPGPRRLRIKEPLFDLPEGWEPMNPEAYMKRYGHRLGGKEPAGEQQQQQQQQQQPQS